ncbi:hypothetical protein LINPERPRIM_LOCUS17901, partial [Linum perenne]
VSDGSLVLRRKKTAPCRRKRFPYRKGKLGEKSFLERETPFFSGSTRALGLLFHLLWRRESSFWQEKGKKPKVCFLSLSCFSQKPYTLSISSHSCQQPMAAAFSWRSRFIMDDRIVEGPVEGSRPVLSPVRTGTDDNCLLRSHCDAWDAMARIQTAGRADFFEERFSVERLVQWIIYWKTPTSNSWQFLDYFIREGNRVPPRAPLPLPTYRNQGIQFRLEWYRLLRVNSDTEDINYNVEGAVTLVM